MISGRLPKGLAPLTDEQFQKLLGNPALLKEEPFCQLVARSQGFPSRLKCPQCKRDTRKLRRFGCAVEQACEADRLWFEQHPGQDTYVRPFIAGELPSDPPAETTTLTINCKTDGG